jgi:hypothetical protein
MSFPQQEDATMQRAKQASKKKRAAKAAVPALGAAGLTFSLAGSAAAAAVPTSDVQQLPNFSPGHALMLGEEEMTDVSLATFHLFDKQDGSSRVQVAWRGCGGCRGCGCRGCGGCRACRCGAACRCGVGIVGCAVVTCAGCCASWGRCRWC